MVGLVHGMVYKTKDYSQFIMDNEYNRDVNVNHVKKIKISIQTFGDSGDCFPIVVDEKGVIIDGQHRFTARKELGLTIYYIQSTELDSKKLGGINDAIAKWKPESFVKVAKDNKILVYLRERFIPFIPKKISSLGLIFKSFTINKNMLLVNSTKTDNRYEMMIIKCPKLIEYFNDLEAKMSDFNSSVIAPSIIFQLGMKLTKYNVKLENIIKGNYADIMSDLYKKGLIK